MDNLFDIDTAAINQEYIALRDDPRFKEDKLYLESLWENFRLYADSDFKKQLSRDFHSRFWEMYLANALLAQKHRLIVKDRKQSPDICIHHPKGKVWVEATIREAGDGGLLLRYTSALVEKHKKYLSYLEKGIVSPNEPYIIAINGRRVPMAWPDDEDIPLIVKAVLPFGDPTAVYDLDTLETVWEGYSNKPEIRTKNDSPVSTRMFLDPSYSGISGVLFSLVDAWNRESFPGAKFVFVHNLLANNAVPLEWLGIGQEFWMEDGVLKNRWLT